MKCNKNTCPTGITTHDPRFQKGLVPEDKYKKVARYAKSIVKEVELIAHSVGVTEPRQLKREHVRVVQDTGKSVAMDQLYPDVGAR
jgi:glutamate synthase domain-containing protein 2